MSSTSERSFAPGDPVRIRVHRTGVLPLRPGDTATVRGTGLRDYTHSYIAVTVTLPAGTVHTSFAPDELEHIRKDAL